MPRNGSGTFNRLYSWEQDAANNIKIRADRMDAEMDGMATALSNSIAVDGQTAITANLPMSGFKHTGVAAATAAGEYLTFGQSGAQVSYETLSDLQSANVPASVDLLYLQGHTTVGIGGQHRVRRASDPGHPGADQSADGAWWELAERSPKVTMFGALLDGSNDDTQAWRDAFDYAMHYLQNGSIVGMTIRMPRGVSIANDELMSDAFQEAWGNQTDIRKNNGIFVVGEGGASATSVLQVGPGWSSAVRNTANGNERPYGPWSGQPSPAALFPVMKFPDVAAGAQFGIKGIRTVGTDTPGKDPIPYLISGELDGYWEDVYTQQFANHGEAIFGTFNASKIGLQFDFCGMQPIQGGAIAGRPPGFPPPRVDFDISGTTISAKAAEAFDTFSAGDPVPFFYTAHVGKTFLVAQAADHDGSDQTLKATISSVSGDGVASAEITLPSGVSLVADPTDKKGSFVPVEATTTAASASITLSDPILFGDGADDMVGHLVAIPKAGSNSLPDNDMLVTRIISCDTGNDTDGYTEFTLADAAVNAVTDWFITGSSHFLVGEESFAATQDRSTSQPNDTDYIKCRWAKSSGFSSDVLPTSGFQMVLQGATGATQYLGCKVHGASPIRASGFAADGQIIIDNSNVDWIAGTTTHMTNLGSSIRFMGASCRGVWDSEVGGFQIPHDWSAVFADPQSGFDIDDWGMRTELYLLNTSFPAHGQQLENGNPTPYNVHRVFTSSSEKSFPATILDNTDDIDSVRLPGNYIWYGVSETPTNVPTGFQNSIMQVYGDGINGGTQVIYDRTRQLEIIRDTAVSGWTVWRYKSTRFFTTAQFGDASHEVNTIGKDNGVMHVDSDTNMLMVAHGSSAGAAWFPADGSAGIFPS